MMLDIRLASLKEKSLGMRPLHAACCTRVVVTEKPNDIVMTT